jgi:hypothetical protein
MSASIFTQPGIDLSSGGVIGRLHIRTAGFEMKICPAPPLARCPWPNAMACFTGDTAKAVIPVENDRSNPEIVIT